MTALHTDLYEIRMAVSYLRRGMTEPATFSLFARTLPHDRGFLVAAGLADCLTFLERFGFADDELAYLRDHLGMARADLDALARLRFDGDVWAVPEGRVVFAGEPLLEVTAPLPQAQLVETALLNFVTFQSLVATKAARCRIAAPDAELIDFAARRAHGLGAALAVARAAAVVGFAGTSNVAAAREFGLTPLGTMAHSYVQAFPSEAASFTAFAEDFPDNAVFLVDTYDTVGGVRAAIEVAGKLALPDDRVGIRLDSGDLSELAHAARRLLDAAGLRRARIVASGGLDEHELAALVASGAPIDSYGVGTRFGVSADAPSLDSAYKLVEYAGRPVRKLSPGKVSVPGAKQVYRRAPGEPDMLALRQEAPPPRAEPLLARVMHGGRRAHPAETREKVSEARDRFDHDLAWLPRAVCRLRAPDTVPVRHSAALLALSERPTGVRSGPDRGPSHSL
ncbi:nicotinate phosphoribosyltransferase [Saccharomonospora sp. NPDC046836]|uniref:nicotinate phosphoribosyltransferase n=1 Tax=Saccharomonospora sp. NPDC046836 TaxID=3156921 RepID=UPI0033C038B1